jgi:hypothetical protein
MEPIMKCEVCGKEFHALELVFCSTCGLRVCIIGDNGGCWKNHIEEHERTFSPFGGFAHRMESLKQ